MGKRGQVTIFIIAGIILLVIAGLFFYIRFNVATPNQVPVIANVPEEFQPVASFMDYCLLKTAEEGLVKLGEGGGYIYPESYGITTSRTNPTDSAGIEFAPNWKIPYWYYMSSPNSCKENCNFKIGYPALRKKDAGISGASIEEELARYTRENIGICFDSFSAFQAQGYQFEEVSPINADVSVNKNDIGFLLNYKLRAKKIGSADIEKRYVTLPINLENIYNLAINVTDSEAREQYLELHTLNLIVGFSGINPEKLPPMSDTDFKVGGPTIWIKSEVEKSVRDNVLTPYTGIIKLSSSANYYDTGSDIYDAIVIPAPSEYSYMSTTFEYNPMFKEYFNLNCNGQICKPDSLSLGIIPLGVNRYNFVYDISYPVLVEITDPYALNNKGFKFNFAIEANIRNNEKFKSSSFTIDALGIDEPMFCQEQMRNSGFVTINIFDAVNNLPIQDAEISYSCMNEFSCLMYSADYSGKITQKFPTGCMYGGYLTVRKNGYLGKSVEFLPAENKNETISFRIYPKKTVELNVMKYKMEKILGRWQLSSIPSELDVNEEATVTLTRIPEKGEENFATAGFYSKNQTAPSTIELVAGNYEVRVDEIDYGTHTIPARTIKKGGFLGIGETKINLPAVIFNSTNAYASGSVINNETPNYYFRLDAGKLDASDALTFFSIYPVPESMSDVRELSVMDSNYNSKLWRPYIQPR